MSLAIPHNGANQSLEFLPLELRIGYFLMCAKTSTVPDSTWVCGYNLDKYVPHHRDPWRLLDFAYAIKNKLMAPALR